jgi:hypothetical protein
MSKEMEKFAYDGYPPLEPDDPNLDKRMKDLLLPGIVERLSLDCSDAAEQDVLDQATSAYRKGGKPAAVRAFKRALDGYAIKR